MRSGVWSPSLFSRGLLVLILAAVVFRLVHLWQLATVLPFLSHPILDAALYHALVRARDTWPSARRAVLLGATGIVLFSVAPWVSPLGAARNRVWESNLFVEAGMVLEAKGDQDGAPYLYQARILKARGDLRARELFEKALVRDPLL